MKLIILESPNKVKTVKSFLSSDYTVIASVGHVTRIADTGPYQMGIDTANGFTINYIEDENKKDVIKKIKMLAKQAEKVIFATDNDREGYAIAWHIKELLKLPDKKCCRVVFNEITKKCVLNALENPVDFNLPLVAAAETRAIEDKIIGYRISPILRQMMSGKSAGRVQSSVLKIICDREKEIINFKPETYYNIALYYKVNGIDYKMKYVGTGKKTSKKLTDEKKVKQIIDECNAGTYTVTNITSKTRKVSPKAPFTTSTFQQECSSKLGYAPEFAMKCAQHLFEGIELDGEHTGLITYIRTDSSRMDDDFKKELYQTIKSWYGDKYLGKVKEVKSASKEQDAHECLRCVDLALTPDYVSQFINDEKIIKVYDLIYARTLAAAMSDAVVNDVTITVNNGEHIFEAVGHYVTFDGYKLVYQFSDKTDDEDSLPKLDIGDVLENTTINASKEATKPPKRYSEAGLVKAMEESGIGRPSTYASCIAILKDKDRNYATVVNKALVPTDHGMAVSDFLQEHFSNVLSIEYTSEMESMLDKIADSQIDSLSILEPFYSNLCESIDVTRKNTVNNCVLEYVNRKCPDCGADLIYRMSKKNTKFIGCSNFPRCKHVEWIEDNEKKESTKVKVGIQCPECGGDLIERTSNKTGKKFIGCSNFPRCNHMMSITQFDAYKKDISYGDIVYDKGSRH